MRRIKQAIVAGLAAATFCTSISNFATAQQGNVPAAQNIEDELFPPLDPPAEPNVTDLTVPTTPPVAPPSQLAPAAEMKKMDAAMAEEMMPKSMLRNEESFAPSNNDRQDTLNTLYQNQWVQLDSGNSFRGRIVVIEDMQIQSVAGVEVMISRDSQVVATATTNGSGEFSFGNVRSGFYAITTESPNALSCLGLTVLANNDARHLPNSIEVRAIGATSQRFEELVSMFPAVTTPDLNDMVEIKADPIGTSRRFANTHMVGLQSDGSLMGRVSRSARALSNDDLSDISVYILKDGSQVGGVQVDRDGSFRIPGMTQGCYSFIAVGPRDLGVCAFCAVSQDVAMHLPRNVRFVAMQGTTVPELNVEVVDRAALPTTVVQEEEIVGDVVAEGPAGNFAPVGGGGIGGGGQVLGGGGGGGFGNFQGVGTAALGAAGLAGVIAAIAEADDDNVVFTPPPVVSAIAP